MVTMSPMKKLDSINTRLLIACGTLETPEFQRQVREFAESLTALSKSVQLIPGEHYNHFEMIETLGNPYSVPGKSMLGLIGDL